MIAEFRARLPANPVVVEAGAHDGTHTVQMAEFCRELHAFEPVPALYQRLCSRVGHLPNVVTWQLALSGVSGMRSMWISGGGGDGSSSLRQPRLHLDALPEITFDETIEVKTITLDEWGQAVDGLWLDMQGEEFTALKAGRTILAQVQAIVLEFSTTELYEGCGLWPEVHEWLEKEGFSVETLEMLGAGQGNALMVR